MTSVNESNIRLCEKLAELEGHEVSYVQFDCVRICVPDGDDFYFNPLENDELCFQLLLKYNVSFHPKLPDNQTYRFGGSGPYARCGSHEPFTDENPNKAICLAIVNTYCSASVPDTADSSNSDKVTVTFDASEHSLFFSTGRKIAANDGIVGINPECDGVYGGYDESPYIFQAYPGEVDETLTDAERIALADFMLARWQRYKNDALDGVGTAQRLENAKNLAQLVR